MKPVHRRSPAALAAALALVLTVALPGAAAWAQSPKPIVQGDNWSAFTYQEDGNTVCFMAAQPEKDEGDYTKRGDIYAMVTHRPADNRSNVVSLLMGYPFADEARVTVDIDGQEFTLATEGETAWAPNPSVDPPLVQAMVQGRQMVVRGVSARGTKTRDTYSLIGFTRAYNAINKACNVGN